MLDDRHFGAVAQLVRAPDCRSGGCGFESRPRRFLNPVATTSCDRVFLFKGLLSSLKNALRVLTEIRGLEKETRHKTTQVVNSQVIKVTLLARGSSAARGGLVVCTRTQPPTRASRKRIRQKDSPTSTTTWPTAQPRCPPPQRRNVNTRRSLRWFAILSGIKTSPLRRTPIFYVQKHRRPADCLDQ